VGDAAGRGYAHDEKLGDVSDPLDIIGTTIDGKYEIVGLCGEGGFSAVYKAVHLVWKEPVAIKFFTLLEDAREEVRERLLEDFIQEGKLMSQLSSKSAAIVQARDIGKYEHGDDQWLPYMVLEWIEGAPLHQVIADETKAELPLRTLQEAVQLLEPAAVALDVAHRQNIAHRDLKPANLIVVGDPRGADTQIKVLDFGIAKIMSAHQELQEQLQLTGRAGSSFTPNYGAPEQFSRNFGATGPWTDVYAMGLILVELMRGSRALSGGTFFELGSQSCDATTRPTPGALGLDVAPVVEDVFAQALALHPKDRFATMADFWAALHGVAFMDEPTWAPPSTLVSSAASLRQATGAPMTGPRTPSHMVDEATAHDATIRAPEAATITSAAAEIEPSAPTRTPILAAAIALIVAGGAGAFFVTGSPGAEGKTQAAPAVAPQAEPEPLAAPEPEPASSTEEAGDEPALEPSAESAASADPPDPKPASGTLPKVVPPTPRPSPKPLSGPSPKPDPDPAPDPKPKTGGDAWDPSSFGGR